MPGFDDEWRRDMRARREHWKQMRREEKDAWREAVRARHRAGGGHGGGLVGGLILAGIGVLFLLQNLGIIYINEIWQYWPVILIAIGVSRAATAYGFGGRVWGGMMVLVGSVFLLRNLDILRVDIWNFLWPVLLIFLGIGMLLRHLDRSHPWQEAAGAAPGFGDQSTENRLNISIVFSGVERSILSNDFEGGELHAVFGGIDLDLTKATTTKDRIVIEANAVFGGVNLRVPEAWDVTVRGTGVFGGYEDKTSRSGASGDVKRPHLVVTGGAVFGGVTVRN